MKTAVVVTLMLFACSEPAPVTESGTPVAESTVSSAPVNVTSGPRITVPDGTVYAVEVVAEPEQRAQGLMYRDHLRPNSGMLFAFPVDDVYSFWMKNTLIPLDMIWIDVNHTIVHVKHGVPPCKIDDCPSYSPGVSARYVLELASGEAKKHNLKAGDKLTFIETDAVTPR